MKAEEQQDYGQWLFKAGRYAEALPVLKSAAEAAPKDEVLWQRAVLAASRLGEHGQAVDLADRALREHPRSDWLWRQLGSELTCVDLLDKASDALQTSRRLNPNAPFLWRYLAALHRKQKDLEAEIGALKVLVEMEEADSTDLNLLGIAHHNHRNLAKALEFYRLSARGDAHPSFLFNMGLVFNDPEVSQDVDAADAYRRALAINPSYKLAKDRLDATKGKLLPLAIAARIAAREFATASDPFSYYINPFEMLQLDAIGSPDTIDVKTVQRAKKRLLQEIELNDGAVSWLEGCHLDRSAALSIEDALDDAARRRFHWVVFQNKRLLRFLTRGDIDHFLYSDDYFPHDTLELLETEPAFLEFLSKPFARQYNVVLTRAIERRLLPLVEVLFDGRRWVTAEDEDICFEGASKRISALVDAMREKAAQGATRKIALHEMEDFLRERSFVGIFNRLPTAFASSQRELVSELRTLAIDCFNHHQDADLSKSILGLCRQFVFRSVELNSRLEEDFKTIERLLTEERKYEARLSFGAGRELSITKEGIRDRETFFPAMSVAALRWGATITRGSGTESYEYLLFARDDSGNTISVSWRSQGARAAEQSELFHGMIRAAINYLAEAVTAKIHARLVCGQRVSIGSCTVTREGVAFETQGFLFKRARFLPWPDVTTETRNGSIIVRCRSQPHLACALGMRESDNAVLFPVIVATMAPELDHPSE